MRTRALVENADTVSLVCALLVRFPELASIRSGPMDRTLRLTFAVRQRLDRAAQRALAETLEEHVVSFLSLGREEPRVLRVDCEGTGRIRSSTSRATWKASPKTSLSCR